MRILHINKFYYLRGGAERHMLQVMDALELRGHTVIPLAMSDKRNLFSEWNKFFVSPIKFDPPNLMTLLKIGRIFYSPESYRKTLQIIDECQPDVAHVHLLYHHLSPSVLLALRKRNIPVVMTLHDWQLLSPNYSFATKNRVYTVEEGKKLWHVVRERAIKNSYIMSALAVLAAAWHRRRRWFYTHIDTYIAPSQFVKDLFVASGFDEKKIVHIPHFVSVPRPYGRISHTVSPINLDTKKQPYFLYAGRLSWGKGIVHLINIWINKKIEYELQIAGTGPLEKQLHEKVKTSGVNNIKFLGFVKPDALSVIMSRASALIAPSIFYETFGLSVIEAWQAGTAVFANSIGSFVDLVGKSQGAGVLFSFDKVENFIKQLREHMQSSDRWYEMGEIGKQLVQSRYSEDQYYLAIMAEYEKLNKLHHT